MEITIIVMLSIMLCVSILANVFLASSVRTSEQDAEHYLTKWREAISAWNELYSRHRTMAHGGKLPLYPPPLPDSPPPLQDMYPTSGITHRDGTR